MRCHHEGEAEFKAMEERLNQYLLKKVKGADIRGLELVSAVRTTANYYSAVIHNKKVPDDLSGPRMGILLRLLVEDQTGNKNGINPTTLSQFQKVKKNTISSLLRGLEESGYVERTLDPNDKRVFYIRISQAGREKIDSIWPKRMKFMNDVSSALSDEEKNQLIYLLKKLQTSILTQTNFPISATSKFPEEVEMDAE